MENNFTNTIKNWLIDELEDCKGWEREIYLEDLAYTITETINVDGSVHCSTYQAKEFIEENFDEFGDLVEYCKNNFDEVLNPFLEPEKAEVIAYIEGVRSLLNDLDSLKEATEKSEYQQIILSDELIDKMIQKLKENEFTIEF